METVLNKGKQRFDIERGLHSLEGSLWDINGSIHMLCQVEGNVHKMVEMSSGNRESDEPLSFKDLKDFKRIYGKLIFKQKG